VCGLGLVGGLGASLGALMVRIRAISTVRCHLLLTWFTKQKSKLVLRCV